MPATYAHYRFGEKTLMTLPENVRNAVTPCQRLYEVGLHGPDPLFNYSPLKKTRIDRLGSQYHMQTGAEFFGRVCRMIRLKPTREAVAYLYGVLAHYALDSQCHPFINEKTVGKTGGHVRLETEFERYLMQKDLIDKPNTFFPGSHLHLSNGECDAAAAFYPPVTGPQFRKALKNMAFFTRLFVLPEGIRRNLLGKAIDRICPDYRGFIMTIGPDPEYGELDEPLMERYNRAALLYPELARQIGANLSHNTPFGPEFDLIFG